MGFGGSLGWGFDISVGNEVDISNGITFLIDDVSYMGCYNGFSCYFNGVKLLVLLLYEPIE